MNTVTLGGDRLGSGKKIKQGLHNYERSTHDLGHVFRTTMSVGTLVPFLCQVGLPGDSFDISLDADIKTLPTVGPLFGSFKLQMDLFMCPIRLYNGILHNNRLGIGMKMSEVKLPQLSFEINRLDQNSSVPIENQQINQSSLLAYLGIRGCGNSNLSSWTTKKNAVPYLAYYDIFKNYYANKQEENAWFVSNSSPSGVFTILRLVDPAGVNSNFALAGLGAINWLIKTTGSSNLLITGINLEMSMFKLSVTDFGVVKLADLLIGGGEISVDNNTGSTIIEGVIKETYRGKNINSMTFEKGALINPKPKLTYFPLSNIDQMRDSILQETSLGATYEIVQGSLAPYGANFYIWDSTNRYITSRLPQQGLCVKTYQSDIYNNWLNTEFISGVNGISELTQIDVGDGYLNLDHLNLAQKVYNMLNRIAVSGGSYNDWISAVYDHEGSRMLEAPTYMGGMSEEVIFQEVVSNNTGSDEPLGTLAGRGKLGGNRKGGKITIKCDEPCYIMGIVSLTPRIDYSQGNSWDSRLKTLDDFHKPALDGIGFQDLITEQMASFDTFISNTGEEILKSAGKVPAWLNYMTAVNRVYGNFADVNNQMYMILNRRYEYDFTNKKIKDLTTYIDPSKFNYAFAGEQDVASQYFWTQIGMDITARRKMSAKQIPNL